MANAAAVFEEIRSMVTRLLDQYGLDDVEITPDSLLRLGSLVHYVSSALVTENA
jgi:hypothetical protein